MQNQHSRRSIQLGLIAGFSALTLVAGSAVAWWSWNSSRSKPAPATIASPAPQEAQKMPPVTSAPTNIQAAPTKSAVAPTEQTLQIYWLKPTSSKIELAPTPVKLSSTSSSDALLEAALNQLLAGPNKATVTTTIPRGTKLRELSVRNDGLHIDLSREFLTGGGSASMTGRVAQVLYTATSLKPNAPLWLSVEGKLLDTLGGEGLLLDQPLTRQQFTANFSYVRSEFC